METTKPAGPIVGVAPPVAAPQAGAVTEGSLGRASGGVGALGVFFGWVASMAGLFAAALGIISVDVSPEAVGIALGITGYALGARGPGAFTVVVSTVMLLIVLVAGMGELPGLVGPTDPLASP
ncbi:hypothetical protein GBA65_07600 [Rubrobacter marinus]|uniref:Uncharacterized protein n=1 Tax=Rubrobacter marinus TaxID=2653852 RepID=A0A6G8PW25_9ACTN|nr:hypothetical protein [Rubrobacter marinus]QIN78412.1 hypothetical protein GBA65_07600 [Rubrobacter marinus]